MIVGIGSRRFSNPFATRYVRPGSVPFCFTGPCGNPLPADAAEPQQRRIVETLRSSRFGLLVGPHGTGKSTLLQTLHPRLVEQFAHVEVLQLVRPPIADRWNRFRLAARQTRDVFAARKQVPAGGLLVIDGIEQLPGLARRRLRSIAARDDQAILATSHREHRGFVSLFQTKLSRPLVETLTDHLLRLTVDDVRSVVRQELRRLPIDDRSSLRDVWFHLYDVVDDHLRVAANDESEPCIHRSSN